MTCRLATSLCIALALLTVAHGQATFTDQQLSSSSLSERAQRALFPVVNSFHLPVTSGLPPDHIVDNAAARQLQADKSAFPFLGTLPNQGSSVFFTTLKPCAAISFHIHPRATEFYMIISGSHTAGLAEENGGRQNVTFNVSAGQVFAVPQGLVHYNFNNNCVPNVFAQFFNSADGGTITIPTALGSLRAVAPQIFAAANLTTVAASPQAAFLLDQTCLQRCGLPSTGGTLDGLSPELQAFMGLANSTYTPGPASG